MMYILFKPCSNDNYYDFSTATTKLYIDILVLYSRHKSIARDNGETRARVLQSQITDTEIY